MTTRDAGTAGPLGSSRWRCSWSCSTTSSSSVALPTIHRDLGASIQSLEWTVNAYVLAYAVLLLTGAALGDRFGRKRMFLIGPRRVHRGLGRRRARAHAPTC